MCANKPHPRVRLAPFRGSWLAAALLGACGAPDSAIDEGGSEASGLSRQFFCTFATSPTECGFVEQAKVSGRATLVSLGRDGATAVRLHTEPGDSYVAGSGSRERNDLRLSQSASDCYQGKEAWWAHSILFPSDFVAPESGLVFDFHHTGSTGQANFQIRVRASDGLSFEGAGGPTVATSSTSPGRYGAPIGPLVKNAWYDFVYHVKWSSSSDGFMEAWVNGEKKLSFRGPTLYSGMGCYLKLANYHTPTAASSIVHDRVIRGRAQADVWLSTSSSDGAAKTLGTAQVGATFGIFGVDDKAVNRVSLGEAADVEKLSIYVDGLAATSGSASMKGVLYADAAGEPAALLATSDALAVSAGASAAWRDLVFASPVRLAPGSYWIGVHVGGPTRLIREAYVSDTGSMRYDSDDAFADGAESPFGGAAVANNRMSLTATYRPATTTASGTPVSSIRDGDTLRGVVTWTITPNRSFSSIAFYANNQLLDEGLDTSYALDTRALPNGANTIGFHVYAPDGALAYRSPAVRVTVDNAVLTPPEQPTSGERTFFCSFESAPNDCGFGIQGKEQTRASLVSIAREGARAVRLHTEPGDNNVNGSGTWERNDLSLGQTRTDCYEGKEQWWAHSVYFPSDFVIPSAGVVMDFHHTGSSGQANFHVLVRQSDGLSFRGHGGASVAYNSTDPGTYNAPIGPVVRNQWYDFVYHVKWSSGSDGFMEAWVNGVKKLSHRGPTLYSGMGCYLKLANYHAPSAASSIIHDRVVRGTSAGAVSLTPLQ